MTIMNTIRPIKSAAVGGKQTFRRDLRERAELYPDFHTEFGHLEGDTIVGEKHKSAGIALVERLSKAIIILKTKG